MPSAITHYTFAKHSLEDPLSAHADATFVGAQGPDPFFFYGCVPFARRLHSKDVNRLGAVTQHMELTEPTMAMIRYAQASPQQALLFAYIDGLFMHYAVDRACHPYIFYFTGFTDRPTDSPVVQKYYNFSHLYMETLIDYLVGKQEGTFKRSDAYLRLSKKDALTIGAMWTAVNQKVQHVPFVKGGTFYQSIKDYRRAVRLAWSPFGLKKKAFKLVFGPHSFAWGLSAPKNLKGFEGCDFLNENHSAWYFPSGGEAHHESFYDLLEEAKKTYLALHKALLKAQKGTDVAEEIERIGAHLNHEGIVPDSPKIIWKLIWPQEFLSDIIPNGNPIKLN
jgi:hypothetical protein